MAFLKFRIGSNNYELKDLKEDDIFKGVYFQSFTEKSRVYELKLSSNTKADYVVGHIIGDLCIIDSSKTSKMVYTKLVNGYSNVTDQIAMEFSLEYLKKKDEC